MVVKQKRLYVSGFWPIPGNVKRSIEKYEKFFALTVKMLSGQDLLFFSDSAEWMEKARELGRQYHVNVDARFYELIDFRSLKYADSFLATTESYGLAQGWDDEAERERLKAALAAGEQSASYLRFDKAFNHYVRDFCKSGPDIYHRMLAIWLNKPFFLEELANEFGDRYSGYIWIDTSISRVFIQHARPDVTVAAIPDGKIAHLFGGMKKSKKNQRVAGGVFGGTAEAVKYLARRFRNKATAMVSDVYPDDEETVFEAIRQEEPELFWRMTPDNTPVIGPLADMTSSQGDSRALVPRLVKSRFGEVQAFDDMFANQLERSGNHARPEMAFATALIAQCHRVFDIGAHIGTFALEARTRLAPGARLLAVEGHRPVFEALENNLQKQNAVSHFECVNFFVAPETERAYRFVPDQKNSGLGHLLPSADPETKVSNVIALDDLAHQFFVPDYIKLDVCGLEPQIVQRSEVIATRKPILYLDLEAKFIRRYRSNKRDLFEYLQSLNYSLYFNAFQRNGAFDAFVAKGVEHRSLDNLRGVLCVLKGTRAHEIMSGITAGADAQ